MIEGGYLRDLLAQPQALEDTVEALEESPALRALAEDLERGRYRHVVLTGMGGSFHALHPLLIELTGAGVPAALLETSELIHYHGALLRSETALIVLSQSGRSVETVRLLERNRGAAYVIGVTNDPDSPLAREAASRVLMRAGAEFSVSSKTYLASLAALAWLADHLRGRDLAHAREQLRQAPPAVRAYLAGWRDHVAEAKERMAAVRRMFLAGRGPSLAAAGAGGLILKEAAHFAAEGMSAAAFRHGPMEMAAPDVLLLAFEGDARTAGLNAGLAADFERAGGQAAVVRESAEPGLFHTAPIPARLLPVVEILPVQMLSLAIAAVEGREAGAFRVATKITLAE
jgi:glucosamine--fructose-6-phosphate aminotransferase (isomerizing)